MTTQVELVTAFVNGQQSPRRASNMRVVLADNGIREYLIGGQSGREVLMAYREPIRRVVYYPGRFDSYATRMNIEDIRRQQRTVVRNAASDEMQISRVDEEPPLTAQVPELREIIPPWVIERQEAYINEEYELP